MADMLVETTGFGSDALMVVAREIGLVALMVVVKVSLKAESWVDS